MGRSAARPNRNIIVSETTPPVRIPKFAYGAKSAGLTAVGARRSEHSNGLLRQYFPKSMPLDRITDEQVWRDVDRINNRPRNCLAF